MSPVSRRKVSESMDLRLMSLSRSDRPRINFVCENSQISLSLDRWPLGDLLILWNPYLCEEI